MSQMKKWLVVLAGMAMMFGLLVTAKCETEAADYEIGSMIVCNTDTKLFCLPNCNEGVVTEIPKRAIAKIVENDKIYTLVEYNGVQGYLYQEFIGYDEEVIAAYERELLEKSEEVRLLAALINCEAGSECYEGQVAVGSVVMNRLEVGYGGNTNIHDVIYQPGQFTPAGSGSVDARMESDNIKQSCRDAAMEAYTGNDMVDGMLHFRRDNGRDGIVIGNHVFY